MLSTSKRVEVAAAVAAILAAAVAGCDKGGGSAAAGGGMPPGTPVTAVAAVSQDVPVYIDEIGKTNPSETVTISPQVSGKIVARSFEDGADLHKGQPLFEIDARPFQAALDQAKGQLLKDQATRASADWNVGQDQAALSTKAISEQQLHNDVATRDQAAGAIAVDEATIESAKLNLEYCHITAPIDGRAGERLVDVGNVVIGSTQMSGTNLLVINKVDPIYADFTVTEAELQRVQHYMAGGTLAVQVATPADVEAASAPPAPAAATRPAAAPGTSSADDRSVAIENRPIDPAPFRPRMGKLIFLDNAVQDASGTVKLRAELPNADHHFWPGQFVNVRLVLAIKPSVLIPATATQISQQGLFVYRVSPNANSPTKAIASMQPVTIGQRHGDLVVVESGLSAGDSVVSSGFTLLQPDAPIMVINAGPPGGGPPGGGAPPQGPPGGPAGGSQPKAAGPQASAAGSGHDVEGSRL
jgi:multidrug efflux system membrane fusion protein